MLSQWLCVPGGTTTWVHPGATLLCVVLAAAYVWVVGPGRSHFAESAPVELGKKSAFFGGVVLLYITIATPVADLGMMYLVSAMMAIHMVQTLLVVPLMLIGLPAWLIQPVLRQPTVSRIVGFLTRPIAALLLFNLVFSLYHFPPVVQLMMHPSLNAIWMELLLDLLAAAMWWPIIRPVPQARPMPMLIEVAYLFGNMMALMPACGVLIYAKQPMFESYLSAPVIWGISHLWDQQLAGALMALGTSFIYAAAMTIVFFRWAAVQQRNERVQWEERNVLPFPAAELQELERH